MLCNMTVTGLDCGTNPSESHQYCGLITITSFTQFNCSFSKLSFGQPVNREEKQDKQWQYLMCFCH